MKKTVEEKLLIARRIQEFFTPTARASLSVTGEASYRAETRSDPMYATLTDRVFLVDAPTAELAVDGLLKEMFLSARGQFIEISRNRFVRADRRVFLEAELRELEELVVAALP